jgi:hypothetical protein
VFSGEWFAETEVVDAQAQPQARGVGSRTEPPATLVLIFIALSLLVIARVPDIGGIAHDPHSPVDYGLWQSAVQDRQTTEAFASCPAHFVHDLHDWS